MPPHIDFIPIGNLKLPLETATYISDFVTSNPAASDGMNNADDHIRMIKAAVQTTFPGVDGPVTRAVTGGFGFLADAGSSAAPAYSFSAEATLGFYRSAAGVMTVAGGRLDGVLPVGGLHQFLVAPSGLGTGGTGTGHLYLELDGSTWNNSDFPALATHLGQGGTTFVLPDMKTLGRFPRSRTATVAAGTAQANQNAAHTHTGSGTSGTESASHTHHVEGYSLYMSANATHSHTYLRPGGSGVGSGGAFGFDTAQLTSTAVTSTNTDHQHYINFDSGVEQATHTHAFSFTTASNGGTEARPEALSVIFCIKT